MLVNSKEIRTQRRVCVWGASSVGKSLFGLSAHAVAVIDLDRSLDFYAKRSFGWYQVQTWSELKAEVGLIASEKSKYKTIVLDSVSTAWSKCMQELTENKVKPNWIEIKTEFESFLWSIFDLGLHVIFTAHWKDPKLEGAKWYERTGGMIADVESKVSYLMDQIFFLWTTVDEQGQAHFHSRVEHTRDLFGAMPIGATFEKLTFPQFLETVDPLEYWKSELGERLRAMGIHGSSQGLAHVSTILGKSVNNWKELNIDDLKTVLEQPQTAQAA